MTPPSAVLAGPPPLAPAAERFVAVWPPEFRTARFAPPPHACALALGRATLARSSRPRRWTKAEAPPATLGSGAPARPCSLQHTRVSDISRFLWIPPVPFVRTSGTNASSDTRRRHNNARAPPAYHTTHHTPAHPPPLPPALFSSTPCSRDTPARARLEPPISRLEFLPGEPARTVVSRWLMDLIADLPDCRLDHSTCGRHLFHCQ